MSKTLHARLKAYAANGAVLGLLPEPLSWDANICRNENGTLNVTYSPLALHGGILARPLTDGLEIAIEVSDGTGEWMEPDNCRFVIVGQSRNRKDGTQTVTLTGITYTWLLNKAKGLNLDALIKEGDNAGKRPFLSANPGRIIKTLLDENQARGGIPITCGFDAGKDSANTAWARIMTLYYDPGVSVQTALDNLAANGVCDWVTRKRQLLMYNTDSPALCRDLSDSIRIDLPRQTLDAPDEASIEDLASTVLVKGDNIAFTKANPSAPTPWGKWELYLQQGGVSDQGTAELLMQSTLDEAARLRAQYTRQILTTNVAHLPLVDYHPGDWISTPLSGGMEKARVVRVVLAQDKRGVKASIMLNDRLYDAQTRQAKRVQGIVGGALAGGAQGSRPTPEQDHRVPKAPTGIVCTSEAYITALGQAQSLIAIQWAAVTQSNDNTAIDIDHYEVEYRHNSAGAPWQYGGRTDDTTLAISGLPTGRAYAIRVRAIPTYSDKPGLWSQTSVVTTAHDTTPCSIPSAPILHTELGVVQVQWDGKTAIGTGMEPDFDHCDVGLYGPNGTITIVDTLTAAPALSVITDLIPASQARICLRSVDHTGNTSDWSQTSAITVANTVTPAEIQEINNAIDTNTATLDQANKDIAQAKKDIKANADGLTTTNQQLTQTKQDVAQAKQDIKTNTDTLDQANQDIIQAKKDIQANQTKAQSAYDKATHAQTTADGKNKIIKRALEPDHTNLKPGDMWYRTQPLTWWTGEPNNSPSILDLRENHVEETLMWDGTQFNQYDFVAHNIIATGTITTDLLAALAITTDKLAANAISAEKIAAGAVVTDKLAANAVNTSKIAAGSITAEKIAAGAVSAEKIAALAITTDKLAANAVNADKIAAGAITTSKIAALAITTDKLAANAVNADKIASEAIIARHIKALQITSDKIAANAINADKIAAGAITASKIAALAISSDKIAAGAISADKIAAGAVEADKIKAGAVTGTKISADAIDGKTITGAIIQTSSADKTGIKLTTEHLVGYKDGTVAIEITAAGAVTLKGAVISDTSITAPVITGATVNGGTIIGTTIKTQSATNRGVVIDTNGLKAYTSDGSEAATLDTTNGLTIKKGSISGSVLNIGSSGRIKGSIKNFTQAATDSWTVALSLNDTFVNLIGSAKTISGNNVQAWTISLSQKPTSGTYRWQVTPVASNDYQRQLSAYVHEISATQIKVYIANGSSSSVTAKPVILGVLVA